jgi:hypothetical protein
LAQKIAAPTRALTGDPVFSGDGAEQELSDCGVRRRRAVLEFGREVLAQRFRVNADLVGYGLLGDAIGVHRLDLAAVLVGGLEGGAASFGH